MEGDHKGVGSRRRLGLLGLIALGRLLIALRRRLIALRRLLIAALGGLIALRRLLVALRGLLRLLGLLALILLSGFSLGLRAGADLAVLQGFSAVLTEICHVSLHTFLVFSAHDVSFHRVGNYTTKPSACK